MAKRVITTIKLKQCSTCGVLVGDTVLHKRTAHNTEFKEYRQAIKVDENLLFRENSTESLLKEDDVAVVNINDRDNSD